MALAVAVLAVDLGLWTSGTSRPDIIYLSDAARRSAVRHVVNATGEVKAAQLVTVGAQVSGQIVKIHVRVGQMVNKGELIAEINATTQQNQLETDKALLQSYQERLESKKISRRIAERQYRREKALRACEAASQEDLESAETAWALARAEVAELEALVRQTELAREHGHGKSGLYQNHRASGRYGSVGSRGGRTDGQRRAVHPHHCPDRRSRQDGDLP